MADFTVIVSSGAQVQDWLDPPALDGRPSRLNARPGFPMKRWVGRRGIPIVLSAVVAGVTGPLDSALGGRLFSIWAVEAPEPPFAGFSHQTGRTSVQTVTPTAPGHYTIGLYRYDGGLEHVHLDIS